MIISTAYIPGDFGRQTIRDSFISVIMLLEHNTVLQNFNPEVPYFPGVEWEELNKKNLVGKTFIWNQGDESSSLSPTGYLGIQSKWKESNRNVSTGNKFLLGAFVCKSVHQITPPASRVIPGAEGLSLLYVEKSLVHGDAGREAFQISPKVSLH